MNQVFKGTEYLPILLLQMDVTGFRIYVRLCRQGGPAQLSVKVKGVSYHTCQQDRACRTMTDCYPDHNARMYINTGTHSL